MTSQNIERLYKHYSSLTEGKFTEKDFYFELKAADEDNNGTTSMGKMSDERRNLIISDANVAKLDMEEKYPYLLENEKPKEKIQSRVQNKKR